MDGSKRALMPDMMRCLLYILKSTEEVKFSDEIGEQFNRALERIEEQLRSENDRMQEILQNLNEPAFKRTFRGRDF